MNTKIACFVIGILAAIGSAQAFTPPSHNGQRVNDHANLLTAAEIASLEQSLKAFEEKTTDQICVLTVPSLQGETIETFANQTFHAWKLGQKGKDNGVLLVVSVGEKNTARIEVGYGLEGALPDITCGSIIANDMRPEFKAKHYFASINAGVSAIQRAVEGEYKAPPAPGLSSETAHRYGLRISAVIVGVLGLALMICTCFVHRVISCIVGAIGGYVVTLMWTGNILLAIIAGIVCALVGLVLKEVLESAGSSSGSSSYGSSSSDSWSSSSSSSSEGFSGGGGDSGGGGASGSLD